MLEMDSICGYRRFRENSDLTMNPLDSEFLLTRCFMPYRIVWIRKFPILQINNPPAQE